MKRGTCTVLVVIALFALAGCKRDPAEGVDYPTTATREAASARKARPDVPDAVQAETLQNFAGLPGVKHVEWVRGDFIMAVNDAGGSWRPVADSACVWIRQRGAPAGFSVYVLEASALRNKRWEQLARSRCN